MYVVRQRSLVVAPIFAKKTKEWVDFTAEVESLNADLTKHVEVDCVLVTHI